MPKIICKLPNASELINGVKFVSHKLGMISEEVEESIAAHFASIQGYVLADKKGAAVEPTVEPKLPEPNPEPNPDAPPAPPAS
jgi:hypothetical protein